MTTDVTNTGLGSHDALYEQPPPWDIVAPQPALAEVLGTVRAGARLLDAGCGTGEHALHAAAQGATATGVDLSEVALDRARAKASARGLPAQFLNADVFELAALALRFDVVVDSLVLHGFPDADRIRYLASVASVLEAGGRMFVLCFAEEPPGPGRRPHALTPAQIRAAFTEDWRLDALDPVRITSALPELPDGLRGWRLTATRT
jgi:2-polyprenyl-3-methyl-5-hydroxy-6-metoxy-1,4-benzoquinol methylase